MPMWKFLDFSQNFPVFMQGKWMHWAEILHQLLPKAWWNFKPSRRFSRSLVMIPWAKVRSRSGTTASNMVASQVGHPQAKIGDQLRSKRIPFNGGFLHVDSVRAAETTLHGNRSGHAGQCKPQPTLHENYHHWWWDMDLWSQPGNCRKMKIWRAQAIHLHSRLGKDFTCVPLGGIK